MRFYLALACFLAIAGCTGKPVQNDEAKVPAMDIANITDTISIDLTTQLNDYLIVPLETNPSILIGSGAKYIFASNDFIVVETEKGLQQFNRQGRFIRQLMSKGKGPNEFIVPGTAIIYESRFYFNDYTKSRERIYCCDLYTGQVTSFPMAITGRINDMAILNDSTLVIMNDEAGEKGRQFKFYAQDFKGNLTYSKDFGTFEMESILGPAHLHPDGLGGATLSAPYCDSIMQFHDNQLYPIWYTLNLSKLNPAETYDKFLMVNYIYSSGKYLYLNKTLISSANKARKYGRRQLVEVRPDSLKAAIVKSFRIQELNFDIYPSEINFESKTFAIAEYSAMDFKEKIRANLAGADHSASEKLRAWDEKISENDNPVLVIWELSRASEVRDEEP